MTDAIIAGGTTFVGLATVIIAAFMAGKIVSGKTYDHQVLLTERLAESLERRNDIDEALLEEIRSRNDRGKKG